MPLVDALSIEHESSVISNRAQPSRRYAEFTHLNRKNSEHLGNVRKILALVLLDSVEIRSYPGSGIIAC
jgi:hypothetical protein